MDPLPLVKSTEMRQVCRLAYNISISKLNGRRIYLSDTGLLKFSDNVRSADDSRSEWREMGNVAFNSSKIFLLLFTVF